MERERNLLKSTIVLMLGLILPRVVAIVSVSFITGSLASAEYGNYNYMSNIILNLYIPLITLQIGEGIFRFLIESDDNKISYYISTGLSYLLFAVAITTIIFSIFRFDGFEGKMRFLVALFAVVELAVVYLRPIVRGQGMNKAFSIAGIMTAVVNLVGCFVFLVIFKMKLTGLLLSVILADLSAVIYLAYKANIPKYFRLKYVKKEVFMKLLRYSLPLIPNILAWYTINLSDEFIIKHMMTSGASALGLYAVANKVPTIINMSYHGFYMAWTESAAKSSQDQDVTRYYSTMLFNMLRVLTSALIGIIAFAPVIFMVLVRGGGEYAPAYQYIALMTVSAYLSCISSYYGSLYVAVKQTKGISTSSVIGAIANVVVHIALIKFVGLYGAVISTFVAYVIIVLYRAIDIQKNFFRLRYSKRLLIVIVLSIIVCISLFYIGQTKKIAIYINMIYSIVLALLLCGDIVINVLKVITRKLKMK